MACHFTDYCDGGGGANGHSVALKKNQDVVVWMCNKKDYYDFCFRLEYDQFVNFLSNQCSGLTVGFADLDVYGKSYGRNLAGERFCST